ncbi:ABC-2 type transport system permease protein [Desulfitispora alkaliphila]|uniref:DUF6449 domain-containing protein n=1 Tax=Desulfitispora alkaliphila TaxID=622674 RepID=UPI003D1F2FCA
MQWKTSFLNRGLIRNAFKRLYWIPSLYLGVLFFTVPLQVVMQAPLLNNDTYNYSFQQILGFGSNPFNLMLILTVPVLTALLLFNYLHSKGYSDAMHSLPIKRSAMFTSHVFVGLLFLALPAIITAIATWLLSITLNLTEFVEAQSILTWLFTVLLMNSVMFMSAVFMGMVTGLAMAQGVFTYILLFLPIGLVTLLAYNLQLFLYGFDWNYYMESSMDLLIIISPLMRIFNLTSNLLSTREVFGYALFCAVLFGLSYYLYRIRKLERNMETITFNGINHLFKYGFTLCFMLLGGLYFGSAHGGLSWIIFGYIFFSIVGFFIAEAILQKSVYVFNKRAFIHYGAYLAIVMAVFTAVNTDAIGYEDRIPPPHEVEAVYYSQGGYWAYLNNNQRLYQEEENIQYIQQLHQALITNRQGVHENRLQPGGRANITIIYELKNGGEIARSYQVFDTTAFKELMDPIHNSTEYKKVNYDIFHVDPDDLDKITFGTYAHGNHKSYSVVNQSEIEEVVSILQQDILATSYEDLTSARNWGFIEVYVPVKDDPRAMHTRSSHMSWNKSFHLIDAWLEEKGYLEHARITSSDVHSLIVEQVYSLEDIHDNPSGIVQDENIIFKTSDPAEIEKCMLMSREHRWRKPEGNFPQYLVRYYNQDNQQIMYEELTKEDMPSFVADQIAE